MKNTDIQMHEGSIRGRGLPAINVKHYGYSSDGISSIQEHFKCCEATAEKAAEFAWESACESFWEQAPEYAKECLGSHVRAHSAGRSGGWLVVANLSDIDSWDAIALGRWAKFERMIKAEIKWLTSWEYVREMISANEWAPADALLDDPEQEKAEASDAAARDIVTT